MAVSFDKCRMQHKISWPRLSYQMLKKRKNMEVIWGGHPNGSPWTWGILRGHWEVLLHWCLELDSLTFVTSILRSNPKLLRIDTTSTPETLKIRSNNARTNLNFNSTFFLNCEKMKFVDNFRATRLFYGKDPTLYVGFVYLRVGLIIQLNHVAWF